MNFYSYDNRKLNFNSFSFCKTLFAHCLKSFGGALRLSRLNSMWISWWFINRILKWQTMHESLADRLAISVSIFLMRLAENLAGFGALEECRKTTSLFSRETVGKLIITSTVSLRIWPLNGSSPDHGQLSCGKSIINSYQPPSMISQKSAIFCAFSRIRSAAQFCTKRLPFPPIIKSRP